ncbi:hypothetical protein A2U01_0065413, partial [Trifolium medium]|nr:hypothetical protein [Trifolium medium]
LLVMAGGVTAHISYAIMEELKEMVVRAALAREASASIDDASEAWILFCSLLF